MAFTGNYSCNSLRSNMASGGINFSTDTFYMALYTNAATLDQNTTEYTTDGEASGGDYSPGGLEVTATVASAPTSSGSIVYVNFSSPSWIGSITARGALIYKYDGSTNPAMLVLDFGSDKTSTSTFTVTFPSANNTSAIVRIS